MAISLAPQPRNWEGPSVFSGLTPPLWQISNWPSHVVAPFESPAQSWTEVDLDKGAHTHLKHQRNSLVTALVLALYGPSEPMKMPGDTSAYSIGAVIPMCTLIGVNGPSHMHHEPWPQVRRTILKLKRRPCHWCTESEKFHQYLYGHKFVLVTDHKQLTTLLGPRKNIPPLGAAQLQRFALLLLADSYEIKWKTTK